MEIWRRQLGLLVVWLTISIQLCFLLPVSSEKTPARSKIRENNNHQAPVTSPIVHLSTNDDDEQVTIDNGIIRVTFSNPDGLVTRIKYNGMENVLNDHIKKRGYWDIVWYEPKSPNQLDLMEGTKYSVITENENQVEISFSRTWNFSLRGSRVPLNIDKRYIMRRGSSGIYMYSILERDEGWPDVDMDQITFIFKLRPDKFHFMAISDDKQRIMPSETDRESGHALAYKEAVLLTNPRNPALRGEVDDKYQYTQEGKDDKVHGWISDYPPVGFWMITPSDEFRNAGPIKQYLTSHVGPTTLASFTSLHYVGKDLDTKYRNGEPWKKVFGHVFVYLNSVNSSKENRLRLWKDAKRQMSVEVESWPYNFTQSEDFPSADQRGTITGQLLVNDRYICKKNMSARYAHVGLAPPGEVGSWQTEGKGYQFWTQADRKGNFPIKNVRAGNYSLHAWVPGFIGDYKYDSDITITPGGEIKLGALVYEPPRNGPTLWEIGIPNRRAEEFYIPDPYPTLVNRLYTNHSDKFRQYGLWDRYSDLYPHRDLVYTVGSSNYTSDWFFAHVTRNVGNNTYQATTWQIIFDLKNTSKTGNYTLQLAFASATMSELKVRFNNAGAHPVFSTGLIGRDNAIARHGIHGLYRLYSIDVQSNILHSGNNTIFLTQSRSGSPFQGFMYDYIRLEGPLRART